VLFEGGDFESDLINQIAAYSSGSMAISTERLAVKILKGLNMNSHV